MIVVIGSPWLRRDGDRFTAGGLGAQVARGAVKAGAAVQIVGRLGDDPEGDQVLLALAADGVAHVALIRDPSRRTPTELVPDDADDRDGAEDEVGPPPEPADSPPTLDAGDLDLALRYLPDQRVIVVAEPLPPDALATVVSAAAWGSVALVVLVSADAAPPPELPADATVLASPQADPDGGFARLVGRFAAGLDRGEAAVTSFEQAVGEVGWEPSSDED